MFLVVFPLSGCGASSWCVCFGPFWLLGLLFVCLLLGIFSFVGILLFVVLVFAALGHVVSQRFSRVSGFREFDGLLASFLWACLEV